MENENRQSQYARRACVIVLAIIMFFFASIVIRTLTRQILVKRLGLENAFTNAILFDVQILDNGEHGGKIVAEYADWESLYPFHNDNANAGIDNIKPQIFDVYSKRIQSIEGKIQTYVTDFLIGYNKIVELASKYEHVIQWDYAPYGEYNAVVTLPDGYLCTYAEKRDISSEAANAVSFAEYCSQNGIDFVYAQAPCKISETQDKTISGVVDFSNQNADALIERLRQEGIDVYDFRSQIDAEGLDHHSLFYRTDHHWLAETGLWASRHILEYLRQQYGYDVDTTLLDQERFTSTLYPSWFLGSQGKKVTLSVTAPDDFSLLYPTYDTEMHFSIPDAAVDLYGDFSIIYDMYQVNEIDYYGKNPYNAYMYGNHALARFENNLATNDIRLLFIHDSFGDCVLPFVSLGVKYVDSLDIRNFTGSVQCFIEEDKPDAVIVLYNPSSVNSDGDLHKATFDFR